MSLSSFRSQFVCEERIWQGERFSGLKAKVGFLYSATYMVDQEQRALQSRKWQLIDKRQWYCSANAAIHCTH